MRLNTSHTHRRLRPACLSRRRLSRPACLNALWSRPIPAHSGFRPFRDGRQSSHAPISAAALDLKSTPTSAQQTASQQASACPGPPLTVDAATTASRSYGQSDRNLHGVDVLHSAAGVEERRL